MHQKHINAIFKPFGASAHHKFLHHFQDFASYAENSNLDILECRIFLYGQLPAVKPFFKKIKKSTQATYEVAIL